jgi:hypothetical protein
VAARHDERQLIAVHDDRGKRIVGRLIRHDAKVRAVIAHVSRNPAGERPTHRHTHRGVATAELLQQRQHIETGQFVGRDDQLTAAQVGDVRHGGQRLLFEVEQAVCVFEQDLAGVRQFTAPTGALEERLTDRVFETTDDLADRGLRAVKGFRCLRKPTLTHNGDEGLQFEQVHGVNINDAYGDVTNINLIYVAS